MNLFIFFFKKLVLINMYNIAPPVFCSEILESIWSLENNNNDYCYWYLHLHDLCRSYKLRWSRILIRLGALESGSSGSEWRDHSKEKVSALKHCTKHGQRPLCCTFFLVAGVAPCLICWRRLLHETIV